MQSGSMMLSIVVPIYNSESFLRKFIESVINQTYQKIEIILVDDGSTDESGKIIKEFADRDKRIIPLFQRNKGVSSARNLGISFASGEYITFADPDDWLDKYTYQKMMDMLLKNKADICLSGYTAHGKKMTPLIKMNSCVMDKETAMRRMLEGKYYKWNIWDKIYRAEIVKNNKFRDDVLNGEDLIFNYHCFCEADVIAYIPYPGYHYVQHDGSMTNSFSKKKLTVVNAFNELLNIACDKKIIKLLEINYIYIGFGLMIDVVRNGYKLNEFREINRFIIDARKYIFDRNLPISMQFRVYLMLLPEVILRNIIRIYLSIIYKGDPMNGVKS